jgi:tetratricopeptide (TPR) repeat protein
MGTIMKRPKNSLTLTVLFLWAAPLSAQWVPAPADNSPFALPESPQRAAEPNRIALSTQSSESPFALPEKPARSSEAMPPTSETKTGSSNQLMEQGLTFAKAGQYAEAEVAFREAARQAPHDPKAWNNLGLALRKQHKLESALEAYYGAVKADPSYALTYKNTGVLLEEMKEYRHAVKAYRNYCRYAPAAADLAGVRDRADRLERTHSGSQQP